VDCLEGGWVGVGGGVWWKAPRGWGVCVAGKKSVTGPLGEGVGPSGDRAVWGCAIWGDWFSGVLGEGGNLYL